MSTAKITGIYIYPVKSMKGIALERAKVSGKGLEYDRRWMIVRSNGRFVTQRDMPQLSQVITSLDKKGLVLSRPGHGSISIPYELHNGEQIRTKVWNDICETVDQGESISNWLTQALGSKEPLRLVRLRPGFRRELSKSALMSDETTTYFADGAPMLLANEASLERLNSVLESDSQQTVPMNRFRPNIVVKGLEAFAEHKLDTLSAENYQLKLCFPCQRCVVTTINQDTAEQDGKGQPFKTLQTINPMPGNHKAPAFGENAILTHGENECITVGDNLSIINN
jgi:uncharacterized protein YcbX